MSMAIGAYRTPYQAVSRTNMSFSSQKQETESPLAAARRKADSRKKECKEEAFTDLMVRFYTECNKKNNEENIFNAAKDSLTFLFVEVPISTITDTMTEDLGGKLVDNLGNTGRKLRKDMSMLIASYSKATSGLGQKAKRDQWDKMVSGITYESCSDPDA